MYLLSFLGLAAGRWILNSNFIYESHRKGYFVNAKPYVHDESVVTHRKNWNRFGGEIKGGAFFNMKALFLMSDRETKEVYQRIIYAGGGDWRPKGVRDAIHDEVDGRDLTHIFADPWILDRKDGRYEDFQDWLRYEKRVSKKSSEYYGDGGPRGWQNAGRLHKLHYTFLIDKLLRPLEKINELKYNIFDKNIQKMALRREEYRKKQRVKMEENRRKKEEKMNQNTDDEEEEDLAAIKKRLENKARKTGRFYIDKARATETICEEEVRVKASSSQRSSVKRKAAGDEMVAHLGYMESSKRKNKRSAGSYIQADARKHIKPDGTVDTSKLFSDHGFDPIEERSNKYVSNLQNEIKAIQASHPLNHRPKTFSDNNWWNRSFKGQTQVKNEFMKKEFVKKENIPWKTEMTRSDFANNEVVDLASDSDEDCIEIVKTGSSTIEAIDAISDEFDLPEGIVLVPKLTQSTKDDDISDDIVILSGDEEVIAENDKKPSLKELVEQLGNIPEIVLYSSDSDSEEVLEHPTLESTVDSFDVDESNLSLVKKLTNLAREESDSEKFHNFVSAENFKEISSNVRNYISEENVLEIADSSVNQDLPLEKKLDLSIDKEIAVDVSQELQEPTLQENIKSLDSNSLSITSGLPTLMDVEDVLPTPAIVSQERVDKESIAISRTQDSNDTTSTVKSTSSATAVESSRKDILQDLLQTISDRQEDTNEHLVVNNVYIPNVLYDKMTESSSSPIIVSKLQSISSHICHEFDIHANFEDASGRPRRGRRKKVVETEEDDDTEGGDIVKMSNLIILLRQLSMHVSRVTLLKPEILNVLFHKFFLENKEPILFHLAEDLLAKYFMLHFGKKGCHREELMVNLLSSLRNVTNKSLFQKFELNVNDVKSVHDFVKEVFDKSLDDENEYCVSSKHLLKILMTIIKKDFVLWWRYGRRKGMPVLYYVFGGSDASFVSNTCKFLPKLYKKHILQSNDEMHIKDLVTISAMMTAFLDQKEKQDLVHLGCKTGLARAFAVVVEDIEDDKKVFMHLQLLQPSWFSFLVGKLLLERRRNMQITKLSDLCQKFHKISDKSALILESTAQKYCSFSYPHVIFRAKWFFSSNNASEARFEVFSKMKKLAVDTSKHSKKEIIFKSKIRKNVKEIGKDLATFTNFASKDHEKDATEEDEVGAISSLFFRMNLETDLGWHPAVNQQ